ncbi:response regulator [Thermogutta sp.]|jgi:DNA-binding NtrC family response regulator|uniref:response regulator n=1 Tax=Thermogutta sp. TaxID=1962930 RepID=UPI00321FC7F2
MSTERDTLVLIVDDDVNVLRGLTRALRHQPFQLLTARSAEDAQEILKRWLVDVVICDQNMPGTRGTELLAWIAEHSPRTARIILTGQPDLKTAIEAINRGQVFRFLTKPCSDWDLVMAIHDALQAVRSSSTLASRRPITRLPESAAG